MKFLKTKFRCRPGKNRHFFRAVCYCLRFTGLWSFEVTYNANGSIRSSRVGVFDCFRSLIVICIYLLLIRDVYDMYTGIKNSALRNKDSAFSALVFYICYIPSCAFGIVGIVMNLFVRNMLVSILKNFEMFDTKVRLDS